MKSIVHCYAGLFLVTVGWLLCSCGTSSAENEEKKKAAAAEVPAIPVFNLEKKQLVSSLTIPGELNAFQQVDLFAKVNSFVKKLYVDVGSEVKSGQLLILMEAPEVDSRVAGAKSRLKSQEALYIASKASYDRLLNTSKTPGTVSPNDLEQAFAQKQSGLAQLEAAKAEYNEASANKNYLEIRAPFDGVITARNVSAGAYVGTGGSQPIFTLQQQKKLRLIVSVPEAYTQYLARATEVEFKVDALAGQTFKAKVNRLAGALDTRLRAQQTEMDVINTNKKLLPGMIAEVLLPMNASAKNFVVPTTAVLNSTQGVYVIRTVGDKAEWVTVETGQSTEDSTEVFSSGLKTGEELVKQATEEIRNGAAIKKKRG